MPITPWRCEQYTNNTPNTGSEIRAERGACGTLPLPITPWRCEQYKEREENLTEFTLA
ncbi:MAG: hypothetical protein ACLSU0_01700 [Oscillospiraceae bacterium]